MTLSRNAWPPVLEPARPPTHFTIEESRRAMREAVEEERAAGAARRRRARNGGEPGTAPQG